MFNQSRLVDFMQEMSSIGLHPPKSASTNCCAQLQFFTLYFISNKTIIKPKRKAAIFLQYIGTVVDV